MNRSKKLICLLCVLALCLGLCGCGGSGSSTVGIYRILQTFEEHEFSIGFRNDDFVRYYVEAAIQTMAADGTVTALASKWFAANSVSFRSDAEALERLGDIPPRELLVGCDPAAYPMSYLQDNGAYVGFDVDMALEVCNRLGWTVKFISIKAEDAYVELSSGDVDVAWGGLDLDTATTKYTVLAPYMTNSIVLVCRVDSGIRSARSLKGKTLAIDVDQMYMAALKTDESLVERLGKISRLTGGTPACFTALNAGKADAIITYSAAVYYYGKYY